TSTSSENCGQFSRSPSLTAVASAQVIARSDGLRGLAGVEPANFGRSRRRDGNVLLHEADERRFVVDREGLVVPALEADGRGGLAAESPAAHRAGEGAWQHLDMIRECLQALEAPE